jgi:hypothetical protein
MPWRWKDEPMSTPSNNRDARREARKANIADAQAARRAALAKSAAEDAPPAEDATTGAAESVETPSAPSDSSSAIEGITPEPPVATPDVPADLPIASDIAESLPPEPTAIVIEEVPPTTPPVAQAPSAPQAAKPAGNGTTTGKSSTRPVTTSGARESKTPTRPVTSAAKTGGSGATSGKMPTRPVTSSKKAASDGPPASKTPTRPVTPAAKAAASSSSIEKTGKTPTRPVASPASGDAAMPSVAAFQARGTVAADDAMRTKRDMRREGRLAAITREREERKRILQRRKRNAAITRYAVIAAIAVGFVLIVALIYHVLTAPGPSASNGVYGNGITCDTVGHDNEQHYHANVQIYINGKNEAVPANVGITTNSVGTACLYWLHTHDTTGVVHIEAPNGAGPFKLGDFFAVWNKTPTDTIPAGSPALTKTSFFGLPIDATHPLTVYVDGVKFTGDPATIVLKAHENIWLEYGAPLAPPTPYSWPAGE